MTSIVFLDYLESLNACTSITARDIQGTTGTSGSIFSVGDTVSSKDLMYAAMLPSSNQAANALSRIAGNVILQKSAFEIV